MNVLDEAIKAFVLADVEAGGMNEPESGAIGGVHQGVAPQNTPFPRYHFQEIDDIGIYAFGGLVADHCFYSLTALAVDDIAMNVEREGAFTAGRLIERARTKFTDPNGLTVNGKTLLYCRYRNALPPGYDKDATRDYYVYSKGMVLEIWLA